MFAAIYGSWKQTSYGCGDFKDGKEQLLPMCLQDSFTSFHTVKHYERLYNGLQENYRKKSENVRNLLIFG